MEISKEIIKKLVDKAIQVRLNAYAPYSKFMVGAALLTKDGQIFTGCNVENAAYGATICAERTAALKAISEGQREFVAIAIVYNHDDFAVPCGVCRQFLSEFGVETLVIMAKLDGQFEILSLKELLPRSFNLDK